MSKHHEFVIVWEHVKKGGRPSLSIWYDQLQKMSRSRFDAALDKVRIWGPLQAEQNGVITPVSQRQKTKKNRDGFVKLRELRVYANPQLRPLLCHGPVAEGKEITFLAPATERGGELEPPHAADLAIERYQEVVHDPSQHRRHFPATRPRN